MTEKNNLWFRQNHDNSFEYCNVDETANNPQKMTVAAYPIESCLIHEVDEKNKKNSRASTLPGL